MKIMILTGAVMLAGCGTAQQATQIVQVPVHTPCVKEAPVRPEYEFDKLQLDAPDGEKVLALARDWIRARKYANEIEVIVSGCN